MSALTTVLALVAAMARLGLSSPIPIAAPQFDIPWQTASWQSAPWQTASWQSAPWQTAPGQTVPGGPGAAVAAETSISIPSSTPTMSAATTPSPQVTFVPAGQNANAALEASTQIVVVTDEVIVTVYPNAAASPAPAPIQPSPVEPASIASSSPAFSYVAPSSQPAPAPVESISTSTTISTLTTTSIPVYISPAPSSTTTSTTAPAATSSASSGSSSEVYSGIATVNPNPTDALGACGSGTGDATWTVALSQKAFVQSYTSPNCNRQIRVTNTGPYTDNSIGGKGNSVVVTVMDACVGCDADHVDLSLAAWNSLTNNGAESVVSVSWEFI